LLVAEEKQSLERQAQPAARVHGVEQLLRVARPFAEYRYSSIHLLAKPGTDVTIRVEIEATKSDGFDDATVRTVTENSRTLKFVDHGFDRTG
jgi:hypothetical protein